MRAPRTDSLSFGENTAYALGDTASCLFFWTFNLFLVYYYVDLWGIPAAAVSAMMLFVRLSDAITDPLMGMIADRTRSRWGKFRPYVLWGAVPFGVCGYAVFANPPLQGGGKILYAYITYTAMLVAYTAVNVPYSSLLGVLSTSSRARTLASTFRFVGAYAGGLFITLFARPLARELGGEDQVRGFQLTMALFAALAVILFLLCFAFTRERVSPPPQQQSSAREDLKALFRNRPWVVLFVANILSTGFISMRASGTVFYFKYNAGDDGRAFLFGFFDRTSVFLTAGLLAMVVGTVLGGFAARRIDKRTLTIWLTLLGALASGAMFFVAPDRFGILTALYVVSGLLWGPTAAYIWAMYADVADYGELRFGRRSTGLVYSASMFALKTGSMLAGAFVPFLLGAFGFVPGAVQDARTLFGINLTFALVPAVFGFAKGLMILMYPLADARMQEIERGLASRRG